MESVTLLLVEDEWLIADFVCAALEDGGFDVLAVADGSSALETLDLRIGEISGMITDIRLSVGPDGWDVARHARELRPSMPIVYVTGDSGGDWAANGVPNSLILQKPFATAQLLTAISTLLNEAEKPG